MTRKFLFIVLPWVLLIGLGLLLYRSNYFSADKENEVETTNHIILEKIELLGKLELCKFYIKDIVEHKEIAPWYDKDSKVVLIVSGEAIGCMDLRKIDSTAIRVTETEVIIQLPQAEICSFKINHQASKIYDLNTGYFEDDKKIVDKAYQLAEQEVKASAIKMGIEKQTRINAEIILKPFLTAITKKRIVFK